MAKFVKKGTETSAPSEAVKSPKGFIDAARYSRAAESIRPAIEQLEALQKSLLNGAGDVAAIEEARRQEGETYAFDLKLARDKKLAEIAKEDAERAAELDAREAKLTEAEDEFLSLLALSRTPDETVPATRTIRTAFEAKVVAVDRAAEARGRGMAKTDYETQKKIDVAEAAKDKALLDQENNQLKRTNAALEAQVKDLLAANGRTNEMVAGVATKGLEAAAGVVAKGNEALGNAANSGSGRPTR